MRSFVLPDGIPRYIAVAVGILNRGAQLFGPLAVIPQFRKSQLVFEVEQLNASGVEKIPEPVAFGAAWYSHNFLL